MAKKLKIYNGSSWEDVTFAITPPATNVTNTFDTNQVIDTSTSVAALRVTQRGTGEAFRVEDDTNPDSSPFVINSAGLVGIGTASPDSALHIVAAGDPTINLTKTGQSTWYLQGLSSGVFRIYSGTANAERMRIDSSGNIGIGRTSPAYQLDLYNSSQQNVILTRLTTEAQASGEGFTSLRLEKGNGYGGDISGYLSQGVGSGLIFSSLNGGTSVERMRIASNGNVGLGNTNPQYKLDLANGFSSATVGDTSLFIRAIASAGNQDMLQMYSERTLTGGAAWTTQDWILRRHVDSTTMGGFRWAAGDQNVRSIYGNPTTPSIRTSHISTSAPSGGIDGDIWLVYTA